MSNIIDLPGEERREVKGYEGCYDVSNKGRVRTYRKGKGPGKFWVILKKPQKILKGWIKKQGVNIYSYQTVYSVSRVKKHIKVSRIVAQSFLGLDHKDIKSVVLHLNDNGQDNNIDNLKVGTQKENIIDCIKKGRSKLIGVYLGKYKKWDPQKKLCI